MTIASREGDKQNQEVTGEFVTLAGERYYAIRNVDRMPPFFISMVSSSDHWLFASSTGGLTAGRVSPDTALLPYITDDKIHESTSHTGSRTLLRVSDASGTRYWEPWNRQQDSRYNTERNLYKSTLGEKLCFEETNFDLGLTFRYTWMTSERYGFVRHAELQNDGNQAVQVDLVDGLLNLLPAGTPPVVQAGASNLVNAYKWTELDESTGLAYLTLYSGITDRAEPCESLRANTVFTLGIEDHQVLLSANQLDDFLNGGTPQQENHRRGIRGAYLISASLQLDASATKHWQLIANVEQSQGDVAALQRELSDAEAVSQAVAESVTAGSEKLASIMASADGFQIAAGENETVHHYANVLFNVMRGGNFYDQYNVSAADFSATVQHFNQTVYETHRAFLDTLPDSIRIDTLLDSVREQNDLQLERLAREYLPLTFGRRHGDPSRPWNHFAIKIRDEDGSDLLSYQGNWRDIFQNWEALTFSYPGFIESTIAKFVNASTMDGHNPYRIGKDGIDWEVEEPDDPWSYIGYWGDHQIIYLAKLLELSRNFNPEGLSALLRRRIFSYANVPYRIKSFEKLVADPKDTVAFDNALAASIDERVADLGADGKLVLNAKGEVYQVNLLEKLLVPLLAKLGNLVVDGGIWLNTQRPEWNDANNALVGQGLSMVTLFYMRRYVAFLQQILASESEPFSLSAEVSAWFDDVADALQQIRELTSNGEISTQQRFDALKALGQAATNYREAVYQQGRFSAQAAQSVPQLTAMLDDALAIIDDSIRANKKADGLYHAYNLLNHDGDQLSVDHLYPMLEGQVAALSAGTVSPGEAAAMVETLFSSDMYREDQRSFTLYPDRRLPGFLERNRFSVEQAQSIPVLQTMLSSGDTSIVYEDVEGWCRFNSDISNAGDLQLALEEADADRTDVAAILELYESVFEHRSFTGRSGTMFGYEGLGSIYWHMVSKLLLAIQENFFVAIAEDDQTTSRRLGELYYQVRAGIGFNKTPTEYGAFPTDPYSHTPGHSGASQPGMTGQVKEEVLTRFGELGIRVHGGAVQFHPALLRNSEFLAEAGEFRYLDVSGDWHTLNVPKNSLAFTWCQIPVIYTLADAVSEAVTVTLDNGDEVRLDELALPADISRDVFRRNGAVRQIAVTFTAQQLFTN